MTAGLHPLARPYYLSGVVGRSPAPSAGLGIQEPAAHSGGDFGVPVAWYVGLLVVLGQVAVAAVEALLRSLNGPRRWHNRRFVSRLGRDGQHGCAIEGERSCLLFRHCEVCVLMSELVW